MERDAVLYIIFSNAALLLVSSVLAYWLCWPKTRKPLHDLTRLAVCTSPFTMTVVCSQIAKKFVSPHLFNAFVAELVLTSAIISTGLVIIHPIVTRVLFKQETRSNR